MAKPNFQYEKRRRDLAKKKKAEEKRLRKLKRKNPTFGENPASPPEAETEKTPE